MSELQPPNTVSETELKANLEHNLQHSLEKQDINTSAIDVEKNQRKPWLALLLLISIGINGIAFFRIFNPSQEAEKPATAAVKAAPPRAVEVTTLSRGNGTRTVQLLGQVESPQQATIRAQTAGVVKQMLVQAGDRVTPGMTIAVLDSAEQQLALSQAQARLAQQRSELARLEVGTRPEIIAQREAAVSAARAREAEAVDNLSRRTKLVREGAIAQRLLVEARAGVDNARGERLEAQAELAEAKAGFTREVIDAQKANVAAAMSVVNQAKLQIQRTGIKANSGGVVLQRQVSPGDYLQNGGEIITLVAGDKLDIFLELPEQLSGRVKPGTRVELTARALPQWKGNATISGVVPTAEAASRRQRVRVRLDNPPQGLLPGMAISANLQLAGNTEGFVVSRDALTRKEDKWLVFAVDNGSIKQMEVEMVADMGQQVAISGNELQPGQKVVLRGGDGLKDKAKVKVMG
ncbi:efflux RND transporter periplasmic adaptor subunit [Calothrix sp. CCY 0018]|uniref:efflux RND transporter periplasmic adaptor subunit n=1 Tax=Calothrix sp. CCY 0018 TaxID=3103864 RepID=UPI0039C75732